MEQNNNQVSMNIPQNLPIFFTDGISITSSNMGVVLDFGQRVALTNQAWVVSRVGMSKEHAHALIKALQERLDEQEKLEIEELSK